jgi:phospholipase/lecithinase/hemolysin
MQRLFDLGARRVLVTGAGPLGCVPAQLATRSINGECVNEIQQAAQYFNQLLFQMLKDLNTQLGSDVFIVADAYQMNMNFITNPQNFGIFNIYLISLFSLMLLSSFELVLLKK